MHDALKMLEKVLVMISPSIETVFLVLFLFFF